MAFGSYSDLLAAIATWLNRGDLTAAIPDFVTLAEAEMRRKLRTRRATGRSDATISTQFVSLPSDFGGPRAITLTGTSPIAVLQYVEPSEAQRLKSEVYTAAGQPVCYSVVGDELQFIPTPDASYTVEMTYWKGLAALTVSNTSNWMLTDHPDAYLYGSLMHSAPYLVDDSRVETWAGLFGVAMDGIKVGDTQDAYGGRLNRKAKSFG